MSERVSPRFLSFGIGFPWVVAFGFVVVALMMRRGEPETVGVIFDGSLPIVLMTYPQFMVAGAITIGLLGSCFGVVAGLRLQRRWMRRIAMSLAVGLSLLACGYGISILIGQEGFTEANGHHADYSAFFMAFGAALSLAVIIFFVFQPAPVWGVTDEKALAKATAQWLDEPRIEYWVRARASVYILCFMLGVLGGGLLVVLSPWLGLVWLLCCLGVLVTMFARLVVDQGGPTASARPALRLYLAGCVPLFRVRLAAIVHAESVMVSTRKNRGVGLRIRRLYTLDATPLPSQSDESKSGSGPVLQFLGYNSAEPSTPALLLRTTSDKRILISGSPAISVPELAKYLGRRR